MGDLYRKLAEYSGGDYYPYHMPGHKRRLGGDMLAGLAHLDITEIEGFDNLHDARGILDRLQRKAAKACGADESFYLINGSTAGVLSAVSAAVPEGGRILMVRGCHKAAYHAAYLRRLEIQYLWPGLHGEFGCCLPAEAEEIERALAKDSGIRAVLIVSPTYEGLMADVAEIAGAVHRRGIPLIVDEAHGAHLGFHPRWPQNSCRLGADLVVQSLHKTLPSLTQTAVLHVNGSLIDRERLRRFLRIYQSSSPSYVFMAGMEEAIDMVSSDADKLFGDFWENWNQMLSRLAGCQCIRILQEKNMDIGKLAIRDSTGILSGQQLYDILLKRYHLQLEMAADRYALAMFTVGDTAEGYERLADALLETDRECLESIRHGGSTPREQAADCAEYRDSAFAYPDACCALPERFCSLAQAWDSAAEPVLLGEAQGRIAGEFVGLYPPGIPLIVPGERFSEALCLRLEEYARSGLNLQGAEEKDGRIYVRVLQQY